MTEYLEFPFEPKAVQSARFAKVGKFMKSYQPKEVVSYKAMIAYSFLAQRPGWIPTERPIAISRLWYVFPYPASFSEKKKRSEEVPYKPTRPDLLDNLSKGFIDALSGIAWKDDSQIVKADGLLKVYGDRPRIELWFDVL